jgi:hypothetical protein
MQNLYHIPSKPSKNSKRITFWSKVISDQINSGMSMRKFCRLHDFKYSSFKNYKYRIQKAAKAVDRSKENNVQNLQNEKNITKFIQLQVTKDAPINIRPESKNDDGEKSEIEIAFNNGHKIIISTTFSENNLLLIFKTVAELPC